MIEIIFTRPLTIYDSSEPINWALSFFKSEAFTFSSASLIEFIQTLTRNVATHRKVFAPFLFIAFDRKMIPFFRFSLKLRSFLSQFFFRFSIMCRWVFHKTMILRGFPGCEMIISYPARPRARLHYEPPPAYCNTSTRRNRQRHVIWFNPPYSKNVKTNIARDFLRLLDKHFPPSHTLNNIFNRHTVRISYSCTDNMKSF